MKVLVWCATGEDETFLEQYNRGRLTLDYREDTLTILNAHEAQGYEAVVILTRCMVDEPVARCLAAVGVRFIACKSAGYDHVDLEALRRYGIKAANVPLYSPNAIAEYVVMTVLMTLRKMKRQLRMTEAGDYSLSGIRGPELRSQTVGIVGTGRIGMETLKLFSAFTRDILLYDLYEREEARALGTYTALEEIYARCQIIIFHCPLTGDNRHMVNRETIAQMRPGVILVNPARGGLFDYEAVLEGIKSKRVGGLVFDVYGREKEFLRKCLPGPGTGDLVFDELTSMEQVIYTAHSAFYTDTASRNMAETTVENLAEYGAGGFCSHELT